MNEKTIIKDMYNAIELPESNLSEGILSQIHGQKKITRHHTFRPAIIALTVTILMLTGGLTVFAEDIVGLIKQINFTGGSANQVEQLIGEYDDNVIITHTISGHDNPYNDDVKWQDHNFDSLDEAKDTIMNFNLIEPDGLSDNWSLRSITAFSDGDETAPKWIELIYDDKSTNPAGKIYSSIDEIPRHTEFYVYQEFMGEGAAASIDTTEEIQNITVNGVNMILTGPMPYDWHNGYSLIWVQDGILVIINPSQCTYDELIAFAEAFIQ